MKTAILIGATGVTGQILLKKLIEDSLYTKIVLFSRSKSSMKSSKIEEHLIDFNKFLDYKEVFIGDVVFCCVGTTNSKTPDKKKYHAIDVGIPDQAATLSKQNNIACFIVISSMGASLNSKYFYNRIKGEMETKVLEKHIENTYIVRPSLLAGERKEKRFGEAFAKQFFAFFAFLIPANYKMIAPETVAEAMLLLASRGYSKKILLSGEIVNYVSHD